MKKKPSFKSGDYVTDGRDVFAVIGSGRYGLEIECVRSGNSWDMVKPVGLKKCRKPKTLKQEHLELCRKYGNAADAYLYRKFSGELIALMRKHGQSIYL